MQQNLMSSVRNIEVIWGPEEKSSTIIDHPVDSSRIRVAAYCRVSTDYESQTNSLKLQERYYRSLIQQTPNWQLVGVFSDEGVSGTKMKERTEFQRLMRLCEEGKVDKVLCKSIQRFSRNVSDFLESIRFLKAHKISMFFERENIDILSESSEFLLSTLAAISQEESHSISENIRWSISKRFQNGIPVFKKILGYDTKSTGGTQIVSINEPESEIVKKIFELAISGKGYKEIAEIMMDHSFMTASSRSEWSGGYVKDILKNERYLGEAICQKTYTQNHINHKRIQNTGQKPKYLIMNNHPAIIDRSTFEEVQKMLVKRKSNLVQPRQSYPLSGRIICGECGAKYHHYTAGKPSWRCSRSLMSTKLCGSDRIYEKQIEAVLVKAMHCRYDFTDRNLIFKLRSGLEAAHSIQPVLRLSGLKQELKDTVYHDLYSSNEDREIPSEVRKQLEIKLNQQASLVRNLDLRRPLRAETLKWLEQIPRGVDRNFIIQQQINMKRILAWVLSIKILSPISFEVKWFDDSVTVVEISIK